MKFKRILGLILGIGALMSMNAQQSLFYSAEIMGNASTGDFAPYFIGSLNHGKIVRKNSALADVAARVDLDESKRFSWGAGAEFVAGYSSGNKYEQWSAEQQQWHLSEDRPSAIWIQQLYGKIKYRGVFLRVGQKDQKSFLLDERLSSGDLTRSSNARGIPGAEIGFIDFQNIPFTNGWVQIDGVVEYGKFMDNDFIKKQYNYYSWLIALNTYYTYKRCYFRTKPSQPFSITIGMQTAGQFGGSTYYYSFGKLRKTENRGFRFVDIFKMFLPIQGNGNNFYEGNSLGSWDFKARYRLKNGDEISFAFEWPWEDGSGIGKMNGWDGLWGLYYTTSDRNRIVNGIGIEWLEFCNQSGPIHNGREDNPGTTLTGHADGGDNYYNNDTYSSFTNYGMAIATPFLVSPIYNLNGYPAFLHNRARGLHLAVTGRIDCVGLDYAVKYSYQQGWGMGRIHQSHCLTDNSALIDINWNAARILNGLSVKAELALDAGNLRGNNFGAMVGVKYTGAFKFRK